MTEASIAVAGEHAAAAAGAAMFAAERKSRCRRTSCFGAAFLIKAVASAINALRAPLVPLPPLARGSFATIHA